MKTSSDKLNKIETLIENTWPDENEPGVAVTVIENTGLFSTYTRGVTNIDDPSPITYQTNFRIASVSKQFTSMSILILQKKGMLSIDDSITEYLPEFSPWADKVTIRNLMQHTSGLKDYESLMPDDTAVPILDDGVVKLLSENPGLDFEPGTNYHYSNSGYACLAMIVERASGRTYVDFLDKEVFKPLGMMNTLAFRNGVNTVPNRAYGHRLDSEGNLEFADQSMTSSVLGDGGIYTSLHEYLLWDQALRTGDSILPDRNVIEEAFTSGELVNGKKIDYGFGWQIEDNPGDKVVWHTGGTRGFNHCVRRHLDHGYTIVVFSNRNGTEPKEIAWKISEILTAE